MSNATLHKLLDQEICAKCSQKSGGCCVTDPSSVSNCFPLSMPEVFRLLPYSNLVEESGTPLPKGMVQVLYEKGKKILDLGKDCFFEEPYTIEILAQKASRVVAAETTLPSFSSSLKMLLPQYIKQLEKALPEGKFHFRLPTRENGSCTFLGSKGCRVPRQARPWYCQSYPGWIYRNQVTILLDSECLVTQGTSDPSVPLARLGMTDSDIHFFYEQMLLDWGFIS